MPDPDGRVGHLPFGRPPSGTRYPVPDRSGIWHLASAIRHLESAIAFTLTHVTRRFAWLALLVALIATACDSGTTTPTTSPPGVPTTTTTIENDTCGRLAEDTARYLESVVEVLDDATLAETRDPALWPEGLVALEQQGKDLDARSEKMRCDRGEVQTAAFLAADLDADSELAHYLLQLLGRE